ncbi:MAG TPA: hypothetical protein VKS82_12015 [Streptosporangiaceae bacterium]|nr:hypothetical protein [Streptosporangiaceae bacterium]
MADDRTSKIIEEFRASDGTVGGQFEARRWSPAGSWRHPPRE